MLNYDDRLVTVAVKPNQDSNVAARQPNNEVQLNIKPFEAMGIFSDNSVGSLQRANPCHVIIFT